MMTERWIILVPRADRVGGSEMDLGATVLPILKADTLSDMATMLQGVLYCRRTRILGKRSDQ